MIATRHKITVHPRCDNNNNNEINPIIISPPLQVISLQSGCVGYTEYAKLPQFFYKMSSGSEIVPAYEKNKCWSRTYLGHFTVKLHL